MLTSPANSWPGRNSGPNAQTGIVMSSGMVVPCGFDGKGMPVGAQMIGPAFGESKLFAAAHAYQLHTDFHKRYPEMGKEG